MCRNVKIGTVLLPEKIIAEKNKIFVNQYNQNLKTTVTNTEQQRFFIIEFKNQIGINWIMTTRSLAIGFYKRIMSTAKTCF